MRKFLWFLCSAYFGPSIFSVLTADTALPLGCKLVIWLVRSTTTQNVSYKSLLAVRFHVLYRQGHSDHTTGSSDPNHVSAKKPGAAIIASLFIHNSHPSVTEVSFGRFRVQVVLRRALDQLTPRLYGDQGRHARNVVPNSAELRC